jgi:hypothetical protein
VTGERQAWFPTEPAVSSAEDKKKAVRYETGLSLISLLSLSHAYHLFLSLSLSFSLSLFLSLSPSLCLTASAPLSLCLSLMSLLLSLPAHSEHRRRQRRTARPWRSSRPRPPRRCVADRRPHASYRVFILVRAPPCSGLFLPLYQRDEESKKPLPEGWRRVESRSRPGEFVYENIHTEERQAWFPDTPAEKVRASRPRNYCPWW